jgi:endonuclease-3 related protein
MDKEEQIRAYYYTLFQVWGPQHWWPARTRFEVIVGAYLTRRTSWTNVERALRRLRSAGLLNLRAMREVSLAKLESQIRSAGYFRQKAQRLRTFVTFLDDQYGGSLTRMFAQPTAKLRQELLALNGVGPEQKPLIPSFSTRGSIPSLWMPTHAGSCDVMASCQKMRRMRSCGTYARALWAESQPRIACQH